MKIPNAGSTACPVRYKQKEAESRKKLLFSGKTGISCGAPKKGKRGKKGVEMYRSLMYNVK